MPEQKALPEWDNPELVGRNKASPHATLMPFADARTALAGKALRAGIKALVLELYPLEEGYASNTLTTILNNTGIDIHAIIDTMRKDHGVVINGGVEEVAGKVLRIAHMGTTSDEMHITYTLQALERTLASLHWKVSAHAGVDAARAVFDQDAC